MTKTDPIIAVKDVQASAKWYETVFGFKNTHGGDEFAILVSEDDEVMLCLHKWGAHEHPSMLKPTVPFGNGLILYFRVEQIDRIRQNVGNLNHSIEREIQPNPNSKKLEFSLRDLDGYYLTITEFHNYAG